MTDINVTLIGADEDVAGATASIATLSALSGYTFEAFKAYTMNRTPKVETTSQTFLGFKVNSTKQVRYEMEIRLKKRAYSSASPSFTDDGFYPEAEILKKPYIWIFSDNYKIGFAGSAIKVSIDSVSYERRGAYVFPIIKAVDAYAI